MFGSQPSPQPPAPPPPPPTPAHYADAKASGTSYASMQRGGIAGSILTSAQGTSDYAAGAKGGKSLLGQ